MTTYKKKSYSYRPMALEANKCVQGIDEFNFILYEGKFVLPRTLLNSYSTGLFMGERPFRIILKPD